MAHAQGMPPVGACRVERVRNDGHWVEGDPSDMVLRQYRDSDTFMNPLLRLSSWEDAGPSPVFPGWLLASPGFMGLDGQPEGLITWAFYTPAEETYPPLKMRPPEQLALF